jgi:AcrR family transcriptional regulator
MIYQERKQRILDIALNIAKSKGWDSVTMRLISTKMGVSLPILYKCFDNKESILHEIVSQGIEDLLNIINKIKYTSDNAVEDVVISLYDYFVANPHIFQYLYQTESFDTIVYRTNLQKVLQSLIKSKDAQTDLACSKAIIAQLVGQLILRTEFPTIDYPHIARHIQLTK